MTTKKKTKVLIDLAMTILLPMLMAYSLIGEQLHEWLGVAMFVLFIVHHFLNAGWLKSLFKGQYKTRRMTNTTIDVLLFLDMIALMVSGIIMSRYIFVDLPLQGGMAVARTMHLLAAFWGFVLMSVHVGFHVNTMITSALNQTERTKPSNQRTVTLRALIIAVSAYGVYAFIKRQIGMYLFLKIQFVFFDFSEPLLLFYADYLAMMVLFAYIGHIVLQLIQNKSLKEGVGKL